MELFCLVIWLGLDHETKQRVQDVRSLSKFMQYCKTQGYFMYSYNVIKSIFLVDVILSIFVNLEFTLFLSELFAM